LNKNIFLTHLNVLAFEAMLLVKSKVKLGYIIVRSKA